MIGTSHNALLAASSPLLYEDWNVWNGPVSEIQSRQDTRNIFVGVSIKALKCRICFAPYSWMKIRLEKNRFHCELAQFSGDFNSPAIRLNLRSDYRFVRPLITPFKSLCCCAVTLKAEVKIYHLCVTLHAFLRVFVVQTLHDLSASRLREKFTTHHQLARYSAIFALHNNLRRLHKVWLTDIETKYIISKKSHPSQISPQPVAGPYA